MFQQQLDPENDPTSKNNKIQSSPLLCTLPTSSSSSTHYLFSDKPQKVKQVLPSKKSQKVELVETQEELNKVFEQSPSEPTLINIHQFLNTGNNKAFFKARLMNIATSIESELTVGSQIRISNIILQYYATPSQLFTELCQNKVSIGTDEEYKFNMIQIIPLIPQIYPNINFGDDVDLFNEITSAMNPNLTLLAFKTTFGFDEKLFEHLISLKVEKIIPDCHSMVHKATINGADTTIFDTIFKHYGQPNLLISNLLKHKVTMEQLQQLTLSIYPTTQTESIKKEVDGVLNKIEAEESITWEPFNEPPTSTETVKVKLYDLILFCKSQASNLNESIFPQLYDMATQPYLQDQIDSAWQRYQQSVINNNSDLPLNLIPTPIDILRDLSVQLQQGSYLEPDDNNTIHDLQVSPRELELTKLVHHSQHGFLGRGPDPQDTIAPANISILFRHEVPLLLYSIGGLERHIINTQHPASFTSIFETISKPEDEQQYEAFNITKEQSYDLYSRPKRPQSSSQTQQPLQHKKILPNVLVTAGEAGSRKTENLKASIITALHHGQTVLLSHAENGFVYYMLFDNTSTMATTQIYIKQLNTKKQQDQLLSNTPKYKQYTTLHQDVLKKILFGLKNIVAITDPLECTEEDTKQIGDVLLTWNQVYASLGELFPNVMFYGAHSSINVGAHDQMKQTGDIRNSVFDPTTYYYLTFTSLIHTYAPYISMYKQLIPHSSSTTQKKHESIFQSGSVQAHCLPNMRNILHFINYALHQPLSDLPYARLDKRYVSRHQLQHPELFPITTPSNSNTLDPIITDNTLQLTSNYLREALLISSVTHTFDPIRHKSQTNLSPLLVKIGYSHQFHHKDPEDAFFSSLSKPDSNLFGYQVQKIYNLDGFGLSEPLVGPKLFEGYGKMINFTRFESLGGLNLAGLLDTMKKRGISGVKLSHNSYKFRQSSSLSFNTINGLDHLAKQFVETGVFNNKEKMGILVRLPRFASDFDFLFFRYDGYDATTTTTTAAATTTTTTNLNVSAIQTSVSRTREISPLIDGAELYQHVFQQLFNQHQARSKSSKVNFRFVPHHFCPIFAPLKSTFQVKYRTFYSVDNMIGPIVTHEPHPYLEPITFDASHDELMKKTSIQFKVIGKNVSFDGEYSKITEALQISHPTQYNQITQAFHAAATCAIESANKELTSSKKYQAFQITSNQDGYTIDTAKKNNSKNEFAHSLFQTTSNPLTALINLYEVTRENQTSNVM